MAVIANLDIILGAQTGRAERQLKGASAVVNNLRGAVAGLATAYLGLRTAQRAIVDVANFERGFAKATALLDNLDATTRAALSATAAKIGLDPSVKQSANEAAAAYEYLFLAGQNAQQAIASLPAVAKFATAGAFDMALATDLLTDSQSALGLSVKSVEQNYENLTRVSDALIAASTIANASAEQFAISLTNKAAPALRLLNKDVEEGLAVLAVYADQGLKGEAAGEALSIVFRDLQRAAIENAGAFNEAGIAVFDSAGKMRFAGEIVRELTAALDGLSDKEKIEALQNLGLPFKSLSNIQALLGTADKIDDYYDRIVAAGNVTERVAGRILPKFDQQIKRINGSLGVLNRALLLPTLGAFATGLNGMISLLGTTTGKFLAWLAVTIAINAVIPKLVSLVYGVSKALKAVITGQVILLSIQGWKGIVQLGLAAGVAAAAIWALNAQYSDLDETIEEFDEKAKVGADFAEQVKVMVTATDDLAESQMAAVDASKALQESLAQRGEQLAQSLRTPVEEFRADLAELVTLANAGAITRETAQRAVAAGIQRLRQGSAEIGAAIALNVASAQRGSADALTPFLRRMTATENVNQKILDAEREGNETLDEIAETLRTRPQVVIKTVGL